MAVSNLSITPESRPQLEALNDWITQAGPLAALRAAQAEAAARMAREPNLKSTFVTLMPEDFSLPPPAGIGNLRVAISRGGVQTLVERHPNSVQILFVLDGPVETHVETDGRWRIDHYGEGSVSVLENRWHVVPAGVWHKSDSPGPGDSVVVALHSAREVQDEFRK